MIKNNIIKNKKNKAHQIYKLANGEIVNGVTTIINNNLGWNKNVLIGWARKLALKGIDPNKVRDSAGNIGTIAHYLIECHLKNVKPDLAIYASDEINTAETAFLAYLDWEKKHKVDVRSLERSLVSEYYKYGGTLDAIERIDGQVVIVDFKTGTDVYAEDKIQTAAYKQLAFEQYGVWFPSYLLHLGKEDASFTPHYLPDVSNYWKVFENLLKIDEIRSLFKERKK